MSATDDERRPRGCCLPEHVSLRPAGPGDHRFLYRLLVERYAAPHRNIPGMASPVLPSFDEHVAHLESGPYERLDVIALDGRDVGIMLLNRRREAGCFVLDALAGRGVGLAACYRFLSECEPPVYAHLNPANRAARRTVERLGFELEGETSERLSFVLRAAPRDPFRALRDALRRR